ncbi:MAG: hypothetical protein JGK28_09485 [Microcoleus sp. PH2017_07_MST_O_A]|uniref:papain fold toxin domain-containing protein n=2 Tax=unclassified Microcoleus TaxID=2642155 RepID=UPI001E04B737|nr:MULTISPECIES: papain fold toxin domain-containing protein [unclassified Microcoleus]MCC3418183.1 hypothetical protein [Microcoleus sp. PH2017_07_MST_O_A]MCC3568549.1 hypothetical protein [Microcoleus sp. PH2017_31_RDM_U_A]
MRKSSICWLWWDMSEITAEQILQIKAIVDRHENFKCVECATNLKDYLTSQGIPGKRIKLYTGFGRGRNSGIYDDSVPRDAISENGRHEGIGIVINNIETIFDNHHPDGLTKEQWMTNLQFHGKLFNDLQFIVI